MMMTEKERKRIQERYEELLTDDQACDPAFVDINGKPHDVFSENDGASIEALHEARRLYESTRLSSIGKYLRGSR